jgi:low affinity Fe/Cu permease
MFLVVDLVPGRLSCKFHGGYHGDVVVLVSCSGRLPWRNDWSQHWKSVVVISFLVIVFLFWLLFQAGHK